MTPEDTQEIPDADSTLSEPSRLPETSENAPQVPDDAQASAEMDAAEQAFAAKEPSHEAGDGPRLGTSGDGEAETDDEQSIQLAQPFVGQWNQLISTSNWGKGEIISNWRQALIDSGADASQYSDEAWTRRVGGVTGPHVGRLRRVFQRFGATYESYEGLYWSHFLAALDWDDAPLWLEGASKESWSVSAMREQRWQAHGAVDSKRPTASEVVVVDVDEDVDLPAQGGGRTKQYDEDSGVAAGPAYEGPDFGDGEELMSMGGTSNDVPGSAAAIADPDSPGSAPVQPFAGLPELPDDLSDAVESFKLAVLRHKTTGWDQVSAETVEKYLQAFAVLLAS